MKLTLTALVLALTATIAPGADEVPRHAGVSHQVVTIDGDRIRPSALTMKKDDVLEFVNYSAVPMMLAFVEPEDHPDKTRCHVAGLEARRKIAPEALGWSAGRKPAEIIPPGGFVSVCSLARGKYVFVTKKIDMGGSGPMEELGTKGTISVE